MTDTDPAAQLEQRLLAHVSRAEYQPVKLRVIAKQLDIPDDQRQQLRRTLKRLVKQGKIEWGDRHIIKPLRPRPEKSKKRRTKRAEVQPAEPQRDESPAALPERPRKRRRSADGSIVGVFKRAAGGYGFVRPEGAEPGRRDQDIYISASRSLDAVTGDLVRVELGRESGQRLRGTITEVIERENYQFVGTYYERGGTALVQVDGRVFLQPIPVGDPGAKGVREGDQVVIEIVRFPRHYDDGEAVITEVLGRRGAPGVDTLSILREYDLPGEFPEAALKVAREQAELFDESVPEQRLDFTAATTITIDPFDARDFDDAISLELTAAGHVLLGVHIADVAHFVPEGSDLDVEARRRATSVYLPDRVIPMLPEIISNNLASLQPNRVRYTRSVFMEYTPDGIRVSKEVVRSAIRSKRRFNYEEVDQFLANPEGWREELSPEVFALLLRMRDLAMTLRERRLSAGAIELSLREIKIVLDEEGRVSGAKLVENTTSHQIIEEFMLAANQAVAEILSDQEFLFLRRIHEPPTAVKLKSLTQFVRELGIPCDSLESRFEIKRVLAAVQGEATEHAVNYAVLRSLQKAVYGPKIAGHYALHWENYCHFTSPIRRYPDLDVHRMFAALEDGKRPRTHRGELRALGEHCSQREQRAESAERELVKLKLLNYLNDRLGLQMHAVITGVEEFGIFAEGVELPAEGFIAVSSLQDDYYRFDAASHSLIGYRAGHQFRLGDKLTVEVAHVDLARRELDFRLVDHAPINHGAPRPAKAAKTARSVKKSKRMPRNKTPRRRRR